MAGKFHVADKGVFHEEPNKEKGKEGETIRRLICARLDVVADTRNAVGTDWGKLLRWQDREGRAHQWAMPTNLIDRVGDPIISVLRDGGLRIEPRAKAAVLEYIQSEHPERLIRCIGRTGWFEESYLFPDATISLGSEEIVFQSGEPDSMNRVQGSVEEWRAAVGRYCPGNSRLLVAVSCALAGAVLRPMGQESGGLHLYGKTSSGKTTAAVVAGSVLGGGTENGCVKGWMATASGMEGLAAARNDSCLLLDEMGRADPRQVNDIIYMIANGQGKNRARVDGSSQPASDWAVSVVSTGEVTSEQHAASAGTRSRGGTPVRLVDIPADAGAGMGLFEEIHGAASSAKFSDQLKADAKRIYGAPYRLWVEGLAGSVAGSVEMLKERADAFFRDNCPAGASPEVGRVVKRIAVIAAAGELATDFDVTGWKEGDATWGCQRCLEDWIKQRGGVGGFDAQKMISQVRAFLRTWGDTDRFPSGFSIGAPEKRRSYKAPAGFRKDGSFFFFPDVFKEEVCTGYSHEAVCHALKDAGFLDFTPDRLTKQTDVPSKKGGRYYAVKDAILHEDADD